MSETQRFAAGLRELATMYETYPGMPLPNPYLFSYGASPQQLVELAKAQGARETKKEYSGEQFVLVKEFSGDLQVRFSITREQVCRKVVREIIEVPETIEPEQTIPARIIPAHTREVIEWQCHPLLAPPEKQRLPESVLAPAEEEIPF
jgi:hypothetical protein